MIGKHLTMRPASGPRTPLGTREVDVSNPEIPAAIRALEPLAIEVDATSVDIVLGRFVPPGAADDELDHYGIVCPRGEIPARFQKRSGTVLKPLGPALWA